MKISIKATNSASTNGYGFEGTPHLPGRKNAVIVINIPKPTADQSLYTKPTTRVKPPNNTLMITKEVRTFAILIFINIPSLQPKLMLATFPHRDFDHAFVIGAES